MKKRVLSLGLSLMMAFSTIFSPSVITVMATEETATTTTPTATYSTGSTTTIDNGTGAIVVDDADTIAAFKNTDDFSMNAKFSVTGTTTVQSIIFIGDNTQNKNYAQVYVGTGNKIGVEVSNTAGSSIVNKSGTSTVEFCDGKEHILSFVYDKDGRMTFYIDGVDAGYFTVGDIAFTTGLFGDSATMYMGFGNGQRAAGNNYPYTGTLRNIEVFNSVITAEDVQAYYDANVELSSLVYKTGNYYMDADDEAPTLPAEDVTKLTSSLSNVGIFAVTYRVDDATSGKMSLFSLSDADGNEYGNLYIDPSQNKVSFNIYSASSNFSKDTAFNSSHGVAIQDTNWHTLALIKDLQGSYGGYYRFYLDGQPISDHYSLGHFIGDLANIDTATVGGLNANATATQFKFKGAIDNIRIYNEVLTEEELAEVTSVVAYESEQVTDMTNATFEEPVDMFYTNYDNSMSYRIPSLLKTKDGTVIAAIDQRHSGAHDSGDIDTIIRRREADETEFGDPIKIIDPVDNGKNQTPAAFTIDPSMVQDKETGRIYMLLDFFPESSGLLNPAIIEHGTGFEEIDGKQYQTVYKGTTKYGTIRENGVVYDVNNNKTDYVVITECEAPYDELGNVYENGEFVGTAYHIDSEFAAPIHVMRTQYLILTYSDDDGKTWSCPKNITPQVKEPWMQFIGVGPGTGLQLQNGNLVFPVYSTRYEATGGIGPSQASALIISEDGGETWKLGDSPVSAYVDDSGNNLGLDRETFRDNSKILTESQVVQLKNGDLKLFMRNYSGHVRVATSKDGGMTWIDCVETPIFDCYCQVSVITYEKDGQEYIMMSNPGANTRFDGTINLGTVADDGTITWTTSKMIHKGKYQYSCLQYLGEEEDGDPLFGVLFETADEYGEMDIQYYEFDEKYITNGLTASVQGEPKVVDYSYDYTEDGYGVTITMSFDQKMMAVGDAGITLTAGEESTVAKYVKGSGTDTLVFTGTLPTAMGVVMASGISEVGGYFENTLNQKIEFEPFAVADNRQMVTVTDTEVTSNAAGEPNGAAAGDNAIDGNYDTYWHSRYAQGDDLPQAITLTFEETKTVYGVDTLPRQGSTSGHIADYMIEVSTDGTTFTKVAEGTFESGYDWKSVEFAPVQAKYLRLTALSASPSYCCSLAEIEVYEYLDGSIIDADTAKLEALVAKAKEEVVKTDLYSPAQIEALQAQIDASQALIDATTPVSETMVSNAENKLSKAIKELVDTTKAKEIIATAEAVTNSNGDYSTASFTAYTNKVAEAKEVIDDITTKRNVTDIKMKVDYGNTLLVDVTALKTALTAANGADFVNKTPQSKQAVLDAMTSGAGLLETATTDDQVTTAIDALNNAIDGLTNIADKTPIANAIAAANENNESDYTAGSWAALQEAIKTAEAVKTNDDATVEDVTGAVDTVMTAEEALVSVKALKDKVAEVKDTDLSGKTDESKATFEAALKAANDTLAKADATPEEIAKAVEDLTNAFTGLEDKPVIVKPDKVTGVKASKDTYSSVKLTWTKVEGASGYEIMRSTKANSETGTTVVVGDVNSAIVNKLKTGQTYYFKVRAIRADEAGDVYGDYSSEAKQTPTMDKAPVLASVTQKTYGTLQVTWKGVAGAQNYYLERRVAGTSTWKHLKTFPSKARTAESRSLNTGTKYEYRVRAGRYKGDVKSPYSNIKGNTPVMKTTTVTVAKKAATSAKVSWKTVSGATGYEVYRATSSAGKYAKIKTLKADEKSMVNSKLVKGKTYYYKVRAYRTIGGKKVYNKFSKVVSYKVK